LIIGTNFPIRSEYSHKLEDHIAAGNDPFEAFEAAGLDFVELALTDERGLNRSALQADVDELHRRGMRVNMHPYYHCAGFGTNSETASLRPNLQAMLQVAADTAQHEGRAINLNFHAASGPGQRATLLTQSHDFFHWLMDASDGMNVIITAEHQLPPKRSSSYVRIGDHFDELLMLKSKNEHESFQICWDMGHSMMRTAHFGDDPLPPSELLPLVRHVHIHDVDMSQPDDHRLIGSADSPLTDLLGGLLSTGYDGSFTMEYSANEFFGPLYANFLSKSHAELQKLISVSDHAPHRH
jgi:sugar phosphate isomerase/epimerase